MTYFSKAMMDVIRKRREYKRFLQINTSVHVGGEEKRVDKQ